MRKFLYNNYAAGDLYAGDYYIKNKSNNNPTIFTCNSLSTTKAKNNCDNLMKSLIGTSDKYEIIYYNPKTSGYKEKIESLNISDPFKDYLNTLYDKENIIGRILCLYDKTNYSGSYIVFDKISNSFLDAVEAIIYKKTGYINGDEKNNYLSINGTVWRIYAAETRDESGNISSDSYVKIISEDLLNVLAFNNRGEFGNNFNNTYIYQWLNSEFYNSLGNKFRNNIIKDNQWHCLLIDMDASSNLNGSGYMPTADNEKRHYTAAVGLMTNSEYNFINNTLSESSRGYTFVNSDAVWYTATPVFSPDNNSLLTMAGKGPNSKVVGTEQSPKGIRPAVFLKIVDDSGKPYNILSGDGTASSPFIVGAYEDTPTNNKLNTAVIGNYVNFEGANYRISDINDSYIKISGVDMLKENGSYVSKKQTAGKFNNYTVDGTYNSKSYEVSNTYWDYYLNETWVNNLSDASKKLLVNGPWFFNEIKDMNYRKGVCSDISKPIYAENKSDRCTLKSGAYSNDKSVGLSYYGEIFSSNSSNSIENSWSSNRKFYFKKNGEAIFATSSRAGESTYPAKISIYINSNAIITSGNGTMNSPYNIKAA